MSTCPNCGAEVRVTLVYASKKNGANDPADFVVVFMFCDCCHWHKLSPKK